MKAKLAILAVLLVSVFLIGCTTQSGYATYNQNQPQQNQYVGGGCGVAPSAGYEVPMEALDLADSAL